MPTCLKADDLSKRRAKVVISASPLVAVAFLAIDMASGTEVWSVTDQMHPVHAPAGTRVIRLDTPAHILADLSAKLPTDPTQASMAAQQRLIDGGAELQKRLARAYQDVIDAWSLGVTKIPAIVVDRRYIVYGETDAQRALSRVEQYRRSIQQ